MNFDILQDHTGQNYHLGSLEGPSPRSKLAHVISNTFKAILGFFMSLKGIFWFCGLF